jgi:hypothetical protein
VWGPNGRGGIANNQPHNGFANQPHNGFSPAAVSAAASSVCGDAACMKRAAATQATLSRSYADPLISLLSDDLKPHALVEFPSATNGRRSNKGLDRNSP